MRHFPENSPVLQFSNKQYHGCIRLHLQKCAVEVLLVLQKRTVKVVVLQKRAVEVVVETVVVAAARVRVTSLETIRALKPCPDPASSLLYDSFNYQSLTSPAIHFVRTQPIPETTIKECTSMVFQTYALKNIVHAFIVVSGIG
jgi:hypothetical protein